MEFDKIINTEMAKLHAGLPCMDPDPMEEWEIIVNQSKKTVVAISPFGKKYVKKAMDGDDFSALKGIALAAFENNSGIRYQDLRRFFEIFVGVNDNSDPAMNFIVRFFEEVTGLDAADIDKVLQEIPDMRGGKRIYIEIPTVGSSDDVIDFLCDTEE